MGACHPESELAESEADRGSSETVIDPVFHVAPGLNEDGNLVRYYKRGLNYAIDYFGNHGPYHIYLLGAGDESGVREIFRKRGALRVDPGSSKTAGEQIAEYLQRPQVIEEIKAVLAGEATGGLTWTPPPNRIYEDVTTNAMGRSKDPVENTWGALHEYHHVFQMAHCDAEKDRTSDRNLSSWMSEGMASYSSAKFMENLGLVDFKNYLLELRTTGANIGRPSLNEYLATKPGVRLDDESLWEKGGSAQVYYMMGAWATAYLIHARGIDEVTVLKDWYFDVESLGKAAAFRKHMKIGLEEFQTEFGAFIRESDEEVMTIFEP